MKISLFVLSVSISLILMSCGSSNNPKQILNSPFENTKWILYKMDGKEFTSENQTYIVFNNIDSKVTGTAACNTFFGQFKKNGSLLTFEPLAATRIACPELEKETAFMKAIQNTASYKISGNKLTLSDINGNVILVFKTL